MSNYSVDEIIKFRINKANNSHVIDDLPFRIFKDDININFCNTVSRESFLINIHGEYFLCFDTNLTDYFLLFDYACLTKKYDEVFKFITTRLKFERAVKEGEYVLAFCYSVELTEYNFYDALLGRIKDLSKYASIQEAYVLFHELGHLIVTYKDAYLMNKKEKLKAGKYFINMLQDNDTLEELAADDLAYDTIFKTDKNKEIIMKSILISFLSFLMFGLIDHWRDLRTDLNNFGIRQSNFVKYVDDNFDGDSHFDSMITFTEEIVNALVSFMKKNNEEIIMLDRVLRSMIKEKGLQDNTYKKVVMEILEKDGLLYNKIRELMAEYV